MACGCAERREAIHRALSAVVKRKPEAVATVKTEAVVVGRSALRDLLRAARLREAKRR